MFHIESRFKENPILAPNAHALLLFTEVFGIVMYVAFGSFLGAISGFIFVKAVNRLPLRSTYIKAVLPWGVVLVAFTLLLTLIFHISLNGVIGFVWLYLESYAALGADAILFAYLFNRWANHQQPSSNVQPPHELTAKKTRSTTPTKLTEPNRVSQFQELRLGLAL